MSAAATTVKTGATAVASAVTKPKIMMETIKANWIIILIIVAMLVLVLIVIYIVQMVKKNKLQNVSLQAKMIALDDRSVVPLSIDASQMSLVTNGQEFSYTFWLILSSGYDSTSDYKMIMLRGNSVTTAGLYSSNANPIILLDKSTNKMYICIATSAVSGTSHSASSILSRDPVTNQFNSGYMISAIDYVPLQRWVYIGVVIQDTTLYVFIDGDLYSATTVYDVVGGVGGIRPVIKGTNGNVAIGDKINTTPGYISKTQFFNYALTQTEMQSQYAAGPTPSSMLSIFGLNNYGVRSPVYQIN